MSQQEFDFMSNIIKNTYFLSLKTGNHVSLSEKELTPERVGLYYKFSAYDFEDHLKSLVFSFTITFS